MCNNQKNAPCAAGQVYLFDFDGTLVDSMPTYIKIMLDILDEHGVTYGEDIVKIITPLGYGGAAEYYRTLGVKATVEELVATMHARAIREYEQSIPAKAGVVEGLRMLKAQGAGLNVLTASPHPALDPCLKRLGVWELFDNVWSCEDFNTTKADPEIYKMAAEKIGKPLDKIIFIDDNINAVTTAKQAGMCAYGIYDPSSADMEEQMRAVADGYIEQFLELTQA